MQSRTVWVWVVVVVGCAGAMPLAPRPMPDEQAVRRDSLSELSRGLFEALRSGALERSVARGNEVDQLVDLQVRFRIERERASPFDHALLATFQHVWAGASFAGFCAQGARDEAAAGGLGLRQPAWVLDRLLLAASAGAGRSAAWLEGRFVYTEQGWKTLSLTRIEQPRSQHSDLELAPCDVEAGLR